MIPQPARLSYGDGLWSPLTGSRLLNALAFVPRI